MTILNSNPEREKVFLDVYKLIGRKSTSTSLESGPNKEPQDTNALTNSNLIKAARANITGRNPIVAGDIMWTDDVEYIFSSTQKLVAGKNDDHRTMHFSFSGPKLGLTFVLSVHRVDDHGKLIPDAYDLIQFVDGNPVAMISSDKGNSALDNYDSIRDLVSVTPMSFGRFIEGISQGLETSPIQNLVSSSKKRAIISIEPTTITTPEKAIKESAHNLIVEKSASAIMTAPVVTQVSEARSTSKEIIESSNITSKPAVGIGSVFSEQSPRAFSAITPMADKIKPTSTIAPTTLVRKFDIESMITLSQEAPLAPVIPVNTIIQPINTTVLHLDDIDTVTIKKQTDATADIRLDSLEKQMRNVENSISNIHNIVGRLAINIEHTVVTDYGVSAQEMLPLSELSVVTTIAKPVAHKKTKTIPTKEKDSKIKENKQIQTKTKPKTMHTKTARKMVTALNLDKTALSMMRKKLLPKNLTSAANTLNNHQDNLIDTAKIGNLSPSKTAQKSVNKKRSY